MESGRGGWVAGVACGKCLAMKKIMIAIALVVFGIGTLRAQFGGKLVYQIVRPTVVLTMTYYQTGNNVHVEAYSMQVKKGVVDSSTLSVQDTILFDLSKATETHLQRQTGRAIISPYTATIIAQTAYGKASSSTVELVGPDTANGYTCTHYIQKNSGMGPFGRGQCDVWVTNSLGNAGILVMGSYLYYTPGSQRLQALNTAGCAGVVVRTKTSGVGPTVVMDLVSVETKKRVNPALFQIPSYYFVIDNSGYAPSKLGVKPATPPLKTLTPTKQ